MIKKKNEHTRITKTANPVEGGESEYREYKLTLLDWNAQFNNNNKKS